MTARRSQPAASSHLKKVLFQGWWIVGLLVGLGWAVSQWRVTEIRCQSEAGSCLPEVVAQLEPLRGQRVLFNEWEKRVTEQLDSVPSHRVDSVHVRWPSALEVQVRPQEMIFIFAKDTQSSAQGMVRGGKILSLTPEANTEKIYLAAAVSDLWQAEPARAESQASALRDLLQALKNDDLNWTAVEIEEWPTMVIYTPQRSYIFDISQGMLGYQRWQLLEEGAEWETFEEPIQEVDLRYRMPVLRIAPTLPRHRS